MRPLPWLTLALCACTSPAIPPELVAVEQAAEDGYDAALAADAIAYAAASQIVTRTWSNLRFVVLDAGAPDTTIMTLDTTIAALGTAADAPTTRARAANAVSGSMDDLFELYDPTVPSELLELDSRAREVNLDALDGTLVSAIADLEVMEDFWGLVRSRVSARGPAEAESFDDALVDLRTARDSGDAVATQAAVHLVRDQLDAMGALFE